jgi:hypothetical protein
MTSCRCSTPTTLISLAYQYGIDVEWLACTVHVRHVNNLACCYYLFSISAGPAAATNCFTIDYPCSATHSAPTKPPCASAIVQCFPPSCAAATISSHPSTATVYASSIVQCLPPSCAAAIISSHPSTATAYATAVVQCLPPSCAATTISRLSSTATAAILQFLISSASFSAANYLATSMIGTIAMEVTQTT